MKASQALLFITLFGLLSCRTAIAPPGDALTGNPPGQVPEKEHSKDIIPENNAPSPSQPGREQESHDTAFNPEDQRPFPGPPPALFTDEEVQAEDKWIENSIESMTTEEKIGQLFMLAIRHEAHGNPAVEMTDFIADFMKKYQPGGIILFSINFVDPQQTSKLIHDLQSLSSLPLFMAADEEGGQVSRLGKKNNKGVYHLPSAASIADRGDFPLCQLGSLILGLDMKDLGFNMNMSPVADISRGENGRIIGDRSFGKNPVISSKMVAAAVRGFKEAGIIPVLKHFPGHGNVSGDSHSGSVTALGSRDEFKRVDFLPFIKGVEAGAEIIMAAHISAPSLTGDNIPASLSHTIQTEILRKELGFQGIIISDAMDMGAIKNNISAADAALQAFLAGSDIILMPENINDARSAIIDAYEKGIIDNDRLNASLERILRVKFRRIVNKAPGSLIVPDTLLDKNERHKLLNAKFQSIRQ